MSTPQVVIEGTHLKALMPWGDLEWVTCAPGGTESITFGVARTHRLFRPGSLVQLEYGGRMIAAGLMVEPARGEPLRAEGLFRQGEDYAAVGPLPNRDPAGGVHQAVDEAALRGLRWGRGPDASSGSTVYDLSPEPLVRGLPRLDMDQPHTVSQLLDASATERSGMWGVDAYGRPFIQSWPSSPTVHMLPGIEGLAISREGFASVLLGRYLDSTSGTFKTVTVRDEGAIERWGRVERTLTQPIGEGVPMSLAAAEQILGGILAAGRSQMGWATPLEVQAGDVVNHRMQAVDLNILYARHVIRLHGLDRDVSDLFGHRWIDVRIARTIHKGPTVTLEPQGLSSPMNDALAGLSA